MQRVPILLTIFYGFQNKFFSNDAQVDVGYHMPLESILIRLAINVHNKDVDTQMMNKQDTDRKHSIVSRTISKHTTYRIETGDPFICKSM